MKTQLIGGAAQVKITPGLPVPIMGYFHERIATRIRDDIYAKAMLLEQNDTILMFISCDLAFITESISIPVKKHLHDQHGIPTENIMLCATHTHTAPTFSKLGLGSEAEGYEEFLIQKILEAAQLTIDSKFPATLEFGEAKTEGLTMNRLFRMKDGREVKAHGPDVADQIIGPAGPVDDSLFVLCLRDKTGRNRGIAINFAAHPDSIGGGKADFISADWPGMVGEVLNSAYGEDFPCMLLQGCSGDINPSENLSRFRVDNEQKTQQFTMGVAGAVMMALERAQPIENTALSSLNEIVSIPYFTRDDAFMQQMAKIKKKKDAMTPSELAWVTSAESWPYDNQKADVLIQCFRIGDLALVSFPGEVFTEISLEVKKLSPANKTLTVELANHKVTTYVPTPRQAKKGAYGTSPIYSRWLCEDAGDIYADTAVETLWKLWE